MELVNNKENKDSLKEPLNNENNLNKKICICKKIRKFFCPKKEDKNKQRKINLNSHNKTKFSNTIKNQRYNILTFLPYVIFEQLKHFSNQFYISLLITQFFDWFKVGLFVDYLAPVSIVFLITFIKEAYDDYHRYKKDLEANNQTVTKLTLEGYEISKTVKKVKIKSLDIKIGDLLEIHKDERIPADIIVIKTNKKNGSLFIRTDQLDGETDWKLRKAPITTQCLDEAELLQMKGLIKIDPPSTFIYEFKGLIEISKIENNDNKEIIKDSLSLENTLWANTILATDYCLGIVIYTGKETRAQMNSSKPRAKFSVLDAEINIYNKILFCIMILLALSMLILRGFNSNILNNVFSFIRFVVLFCTVLPISVRVNLEIAKTVNSYIINKNALTPDTIVRNSTIPEELGRIEFMFTDKTGTLTKNEMKFKKISFDENFYIDENNFEDRRRELVNKMSCRRNTENNLLLMNESIDSGNMSNSNVNFSFTGNSNSNSNEINSIGSHSRNVSINKRKSKLKREQNLVLIDAIRALALCNNVTPIISENSINTNIKLDKENSIQLDSENDLNNETNITQIEYQASSPDELALVNISKNLGMTLIFRDEKLIKLHNAIDETEEYEILACFPFTSENKRMGILLQNKQTSIITFYLKGSEDRILNFVSNEYSAIIKETTENLATDGLRTLVVTQKIISSEFYEEWIKEYTEVNSSMENRNAKVKEVISKLECNMEFLCITGVEDKLQDFVTDTITSLTNAGIKIWMLTGDKVETATCVATAAGIKQKRSNFFYIKENPSCEYVKQRLLDLSLVKGEVLIIDGESLDTAMNHFEDLFFKSAIEAPAVVCCRCSPTQKAKIVNKIKKYTNKRTLAIGDGGNDVAMIQEADCGIGIVGKEGKQASLAADFSITEFHHLRYLLLWFGRQAYKNTSTISLFVIHRGMILAFMQYLFCFIFYYSPITLYNGFLIMGYTSLYTNFPVFSLLLDRDTKVDNVIKFPPLYKQVLKGRELNFKTFLYWLLVSLFQASVIMFGSIALFKDQIYLKIITLTFSNLIFAELLNIYTQIKHFHWLMIVTLLGTIISYLLTMVFFTSYIDIKYFLTGWTSSKVFGIAFVNWIPLYLHVKIKEKLYMIIYILFRYPEHHEKLNNLKKTLLNVNKIESNL